MNRMALEGVRVVEFGQLIAIPFATKLLADMGAEVIRIESCTRLDGYRVAGFYKNDASGEFWNRAVNFYEQNRNKKSLTLDLAQERARETLRDLIAVSDVFAENFTPRVIRNFGLEYEDLRRITARHHHGVLHRIRAYRPLEWIRGYRLRHGGGVRAGVGHRVPRRPSHDTGTPIRGLHRGRAYGVRDNGGSRAPRNDRAGPVH